VAQAKRKTKPKPKPNWPKRLLLFVFIPLFIWLLAFLLWFNWRSVEKLFSPDKDKGRTPSKATRRSEKSERSQQSEPTTGRGESTSRSSEDFSLQPNAKEKISDEDRKQLENILKGQR
jgi:flagellar biosynthesis/type III secretory pathway M-ring protein FliF/YscJ